MSSRWTVAQVPAWIVWSLVMLAQCGVLYFGFQYEITSSEVPQQAVLLRNIGVTIAAVCLTVALLMRWLAPWLWLRRKSLSEDRTSGWRLLVLFSLSWLLCLVAAATSLVIYLVAHDRAMMIITWCGSFVAMALLLPRWGAIHQKVVGSSVAAAQEAPEEPVEHSF